MDVFSGVATVIIASATGALWRLDKRSSVMDARIRLVLEQIQVIEAIVLKTFRSQG